MTAAASRGSLATILGAGIVVALNAGKLPPALPLLRDELSLDLVAAAWLVSAFQVAGMLLGLFGGMLADRFGPRRVMRIGLVLAAAGCATGALATGAPTLLASRAIESAGFILTVLPGPALIARSVPADRLRATMGVWSTYMPAGMTAALVLAPIVFEAAGWRAAWWAIAAASLATAVLLGVSVAPDPRGRVPDGALGLLRDTLRAPRAWVLAAAFGGYAGQWIGVFSFLPTLFVEAGLALSTAGVLTAIGVAVNLAGNLSSGLLLQRGARRSTLVAVATAAMIVGAIACFALEGPFWVRYAGVLLFSSFGGLIPGTLFASTAAYAPHARAVGTTTGLMQQGSTLGQFVAPPAMAAVATAAGWGWVWTVTGALALGVLACAWAFGRFEAERG